MWQHINHSFLGTRSCLDLWWLMSCQWKSFGVSFVYQQLCLPTGSHNFLRYIMILHTVFKCLVLNVCDMFHCWLFFRSFRPLTPIWNGEFRRKQWGFKAMLAVLIVSAPSCAEDHIYILCPYEREREREWGKRERTLYWWVYFHIYI